MGAPTSSGTRLLVDPSLALSASGTRWLQEPGVASSIAVSARFYELLRTKSWQAFTAFGESVDQARWSGLIDTLQGARHFSFEEAADLRQDLLQIRQHLLESNEPTAPVYADEWVFMQTQSWIGAKTRAFADAFQRAGATAVNTGRGALDAVVKKTLKIPDADVPPQITGQMIARTGLKFLAGGGPPILALLNPPAGAVVGLFAGVFLNLDP